MVKLEVKSVFREGGHWTCRTLQRVDTGKKVFIDIVQNDADKTFAVDWYDTFAFSKSLAVSGIKTLEEAIIKAEEVYQKFLIEPLYRMQYKIGTQYGHALTITPDKDKIGFLNVSLQIVENEKYI